MSLETTRLRTTLLAGLLLAASCGGTGGGSGSPAASAPGLAAGSTRSTPVGPPGASDTTAASDPAAAGSSTAAGNGSTIGGGNATAASTPATGAPQTAADACAAPTCLTDALKNMVAACAPQGACVTESDASHQNTCFANGVREYVTRELDGSASERVTMADGVSTCFSIDGIFNSEAKTITDLVFYGPDHDFLAQVAVNAKGETLVSCTVHQVPVVIPAACNMNMTTMTTTAMASASGATCTVGSCEDPSATGPMTGIVPGAPPADPAAGQTGQPQASGSAPATQIDARLVGSWSVGSAYFFADGGIDGQSIDSLRGQELVLAATGQFTFAGGTGTWGVAPIQPTDWTRWQLAYDLPTKIVLTNGSGQSIDGPVEELVPGNVDDLWLIYRVQSPAPGRVWLTLGHDGGVGTKR